MGQIEPLVILAIRTSQSKPHALSHRQQIQGSPGDRTPVRPRGRTRPPRPLVVMWRQSWRHLSPAV